MSSLDFKYRTSYYISFILVIYLLKGKVKVKVKQLYLTLITCNSNLTDKPEVDSVLISLPPLHQCSILWVFKTT